MGTRLVALNTTRPPFDRLEARRAVSYALDREALVRIHGGPRYAQPTCQVLPPNFPAYEPYCPYTQDPRGDGVWRGPDLAEARRLVTRSGTVGATVVVWTWPAFAREARYVAGAPATARVPSHDARGARRAMVGGRVRARGGDPDPGGALRVGLLESGSRASGRVISFRHSGSGAAWRIAGARTMPGRLTA